MWKLPWFWWRIRICRRNVHSDVFLLVFWKYAATIFSDMLKQHHRSSFPLCVTSLLSVKSNVERGGDSLAHNQHTVILCEKKPEDLCTQSDVGCLRTIHFFSENSGKKLKSVTKINQVSENSASKIDSFVTSSLRQWLFQAHQLTVVTAQTRSCCENRQIYILPSVKCTEQK